MINAERVPLGTINEKRFLRIASIYQDLGLAPPDSHLKGLVLDTYLNPEKYSRHLIFQISIAVTGAAGAFSLILWAINHRLRKTVDTRTKELQDINQVLAQQLELIDKNVYTSRVDRFGNIESVSTAFCKAMGYEMHELIGRNEKEFRHPDFIAPNTKTMLEALIKHKTWTGEYMFKTKSGEKLWVNATLRPLLDNNCLVDHVDTISTNITSRKLLEIQSRTDPLTGIANRLAIDEEIQALWDYYLRYKTDFSIIIFDLDHFKQVNDQHGHIEGDRVLKALCLATQSELREVDMLGRWGGEEFIVICPNTDISAALKVAEKLRVAIADMNTIDDCLITASFGASSTSMHLVAKSDLLKFADEALYTAKSMGRNRVCVADHNAEQQNS
jgi:diguanylate cyclase (GGDEF)-like protein/PAS domain S-box-containing protein